MSVFMAYGRTYETNGGRFQCIKCNGICTNLGICGIFLSCRGLLWSSAVQLKPSTAPMPRIRLNSPENIIARYPNSFGGENVRKLDAHEQVHLPGVRPLFGTGSLPCGHGVRSHSTRLSRIRFATARKMQCEPSALTFCKK